VINTFATPLLLLSGITLPLTLAPKIIRALASANPFAYEVTASRALFLGNFGDSASVVSAILLAGLAALAFLWAIRSFKRAAA
jgi:ABC-2 type transport system permease protein